MDDKRKLTDDVNTAIPTTEASPAAPKKGPRRKAGKTKGAPATEPQGAATTSKKADPLKEPAIRAIQILIDEALEKRADLRVETERKPPMPLIFSAIRKVMGDIGSVAKSEHHPEGFDFRRIDQLCARLSPILTEHGVFYTPEVLEEKEVERPVALENGASFVNIFTKVRVRWRLYCAVDGSELPGPIITMGEGVSEQHFSTNAAITMAEKAMLTKVFCIAIFGAEDPESADPEVSAPSRTQTVTAPTASIEDRQPDLFSEAVEDEHSAPAATKRRRGGKLEPQTSVAGGAVAESLDTPTQVAPTPLTVGFVKILRSQMAAAKMEEATLFDHFKVKGFDEIMQGQMSEATAFIAKGE